MRKTPEWTSERDQIVRDWQQLWQEMWLLFCWEVIRDVSLVAFQKNYLRCVPKKAGVHMHNHRSNRGIVHSTPVTASLHSSPYFLMFLVEAELCWYTTLGEAGRKWMGQARNYPHSPMVPKQQAATRLYRLFLGKCVGINRLWTDFSQRRWRLHPRASPWRCSRPGCLCGERPKRAWSLEELGKRLIRRSHGRSELEEVKLRNFCWVDPQKPQLIIPDLGKQGQRWINGGLQ